MIRHSVVVDTVCLVLSTPTVQLKVGEEEEIAAQFIFPGDSPSSVYR